MGIIRLMLSLPSGICSRRGTSGAKSRPGFAVPDSVHHLKLASPCTLPLRRTVTRASRSVGSTSAVSAAISMRTGPAFAARADASLVGGRGIVGAVRGAGVDVGGAAVTGAVAVRAVDVGAAAVEAVADEALEVGAVADGPV